MIDLALYGLVWAIATFALVPLALYAAGRRLPVAHVAERSVHVPAPQGTVFALIADVGGHPRWRSRVARVRIVRTYQLLTLRQRGRDGTLELEVLASEPPERFVLGTLPGRRAIFSGTWTFELADEDDGTRVTLTERGEVSSPIARLFARYVIGEATNVERTLADLRAYLEKARRASSTRPHATDAA